MKTVRIEYEEINLETPELMLMSVCIDKELKNKRKLYLYELAGAEGLNNKFLQHLDSDKYLKCKDYLSPIILKLSNEEYEELVEYLSGETIFEEELFLNDLKFLNAKMMLLKQDPKFWEI